MNRTRITFLSLLLALGLFAQTIAAQFLPTDARAISSTRVPLLRIVADEPATVPLVEQVGAIGMTVSDMDRSVDFYARVLSFEKVSDVEVTGEDTNVYKVSSACGCASCACAWVMSSSS